MSGPRIGKMYASAASLEELKAEFAGLRDACGDSLVRAHKARDFLFAGGEKLADGIVNFRCVPTPGAPDFLFRFEITDRFREFVRALAAGELDGEIVELGHEGLRE